MHLIRLGGCALNQTPLDWDGNRDRIVAAIEAARAAGVAILCLPELCIPGYGCEDAFLAPGTAGMAWRVLGEIVPRTRGLAVAVGLPVRFESRCGSAACGSSVAASASASRSARTPGWPTGRRPGSRPVAWT